MTFHHIYAIIDNDKDGDFMFVVNQERVYYVFDRADNRKNRIGSFEELISFLSQIVSCSYSPSGVELGFDDIDFSGSDTSVMYHYNTALTEDGLQHFPEGKSNKYKQYVFLDETGAIVDVRLFAIEIFKEKSRGYGSRCDRLPPNVPFEEYYIAGEKYYIGETFRNPSCIYTFRSGPVPYIHKPRSRYRHLFRRVSYKRYLSMYTNKHDRTMRKPRLMNLSPFWFDDFPYRKKEKSWKSSTKCRHQWEKNINNKKHLN